LDLISKALVFPAPVSNQLIKVALATSRDLYNALRKCLSNGYIGAHALTGAFIGEPEKPCGFRIE
jgi:hypothetical protein